ncbi:tellurite resistance protein TerC [Thermosporothrix hazakensis]|uniref:Tellurite resistance protein TerC n=3 Tax=Thermosporothrix TaxID=768650 RepID=A0A326UC52_THEHA|nr:TerC family protein [Thermosporothrix hazakensis]PZW35978.1 tellurite resistance protein TerC [Thermosporothrix hazakensis]BBH88447.1 membrane protein [Thermosporothrix sp. COM3]GCE46633.1 membrane protein [Thermosporothrix hazakensis]
MFSQMTWIWIGFHIFVLIMLALDLGVFQRKSHAVSVKEGLIWSGVWIALALLFNLGLYFWRGSEAAIQFFTGYLIEKSLSVDNIFVFVLIFSAFQVPARYQHKVLFWGVLGALVMRGILIGVGTALLHQFHWIIYIFGAFLIFTGIRMALQREEDNVHPEKNPILKLVRKIFPVTENYVEGKFIVKQSGKWLITPLLLVLVFVETTDLIFAVDSIPAIFAVTLDPFIVYTSNIFAILGLRSLYFVLAGVVDKFHYLKLGLSVILVYVGLKMVLIDIFHIPTLLSLGVIALILCGAIVASLIRDKRLQQKQQDKHEEEKVEVKS